MLVCMSAAKLPMIMVSSADDQTNGSQRVAMGAKAVMKTRRKTAKAAALGPADMNTRHRRGRALINVGRPDLEWRGGNLEGESDEHQRRGGAGQDRRRAPEPGVSSAVRMAVRLVLPVVP